MLACLYSCASAITPIQVNETLRSLTNSTFISQKQVAVNIETNKCKYLVKERNYVAPIGSFLKDDLRNATKGIDEWVEIDGGNAYVMTGFKWVSVDEGVT